MLHSLSTILRIGESISIGNRNALVRCKVAVKDVATVVIYLTLLYCRKVHLMLQQLLHSSLVLQQCVMVGGCRRRSIQIQSQLHTTTALTYTSFEVNKLRFLDSFQFLIHLWTTW